MKLMRFAAALAEKTQFGLFDDFLWYISPHMWTSLAADAGSSVAIGSAVGGTVVLTTGATDNNEAMVASTNAVFKFSAGQPFYAETRLQYSEANTDDANVAFGLSSAAAADFLVDNGAGPATSHSGAVIFKTDTYGPGNLWRAHTSKSTTQTTTDSSSTAGGSAYVTLGIEGRDVDGSNFEVTFFINGQALTDNTSFHRPIKHTVALSSAAAMKLFVYVKAGGANSEVINVDYLAAYQLR